MTTKQVFISHSSKDKEMAEVIYNYLTSQGVKCWIDFRDIRPGIAYAREIMRGIDNSDALVVVYTKNVNTSEDMLNEIEQFHTAKKTILTFKTDKSVFSRELDYYLKRRQWIDATNNYQRQLPSLRDALNQILQLGFQYIERNDSKSDFHPKQNVQKTNNSESYDVVLINPGIAKLQTVKAVKEACGLGLKEAKDLVDGAPATLKENLTSFQAEEIKNKIIDVGATIEIRSTGQSTTAITKTSDNVYDVVLVDTGPQKLMAVKVVKETCGLGLKEAKDYVDAAPVVIRKRLTYSDAMSMKTRIESCGAHIEIYKNKETATKLEEINIRLATRLSSDADKYYVAGNYRQALDLYLQATRKTEKFKDFLSVCSRIAYIYYTGYGTRLDYEEAARWYRKAANLGSTIDQRNLGVMYQNGQGVKKNIAEAARWYQKAAAKGDAKALKYLNDLRMNQ